MKQCALVLCLLGFAAPLYAQTGATAPPPARRLDLSGPRFGFTFLSDGAVESLRARNIAISPAISQFGWQAERQFYGRDGGLAALNELVFLVGGLEQGMAVPSLSWLVGLRTTQGAEFGMGPNISPAGAALAFSAGMTFRSGIVNFPVNLAVVPAKEGLRVSLLVGFTLRR